MPTDLRPGGLDALAVITGQVAGPTELDEAQLARLLFHAVGVTRMAMSAEPRRLYFRAAPSAGTCMRRAIPASGLNATHTDMEPDAAESSDRSNTATDSEPRRSAGLPLGVATQAPGIDALQMAIRHRHNREVTSRPLAHKTDQQTHDD